MKKILFAILTVSIAFLASCNKKNEPENSDAPQNDETSGTIKDICGNTYNYVKIGDQYWTAENMRCNKYDSESEAKGETISTADKASFTPCYIDATNPSYCKASPYSSKLNDTQIKALGYLYNYSAAVGITADNEANTDESSFGEKRQGICPNGWHIPNFEEWASLRDFVGYSIASKCIKTTSGWYGKDGNGTDDYGFAALPAGVFYFSEEISMAGYNTAFFVASYSDGRATYEGITSEENGMRDGTVRKDTFLSVRCVKN